ncbi:citryl-CoA lyase [Roseinatronobacter bogoriensis]|uniref:citrate synthase (unknown stereospecificity) n=1 Tax=Roseinatronobacter bogoriensis subsp. barguzinensis TaxID=441209 RepID=A0A2K8K4Z5_9RHOB|nr:MULTISPECIES: citryl-CoA lyase [Rhodobaca]ATX64534.1 citryl-CoA lyase [Rhodobaca barguzinensis]MBB4209252.1 citrate synthase [Rhodobaca bogoriensis DSM 18756]TDW36222.1 citrate synthase [Rhodobaca barguzinensis]TDY67650.1 citrate synthase [Rhodobaca bogoriensis DSM 18756]
MMIGKAGAARTSICTADAASITVRGHDLCDDLMGHRSFTDFFFLSVAGHLPTEQQRFFLDVLLISIAEHGLTPNAQAARMTYAAGPDSLQGALAAGILGCGTVILGAAELAGGLLVKAKARVDAGEDIDAVARDIAMTTRQAGGKLAGFGHPLHRPKDPRTERIMTLARDQGVSATHCALASAISTAADTAWGKPLTMNVSMGIAAVLLDLDFPASMIKAIPLLARTAGLLGHLAEEQRYPIGFLMAAKAEEAITYFPEQEAGA